VTSTLRDLAPVWRTWLGAWCDRFDEELPVVFYADDGTDAPDEWADGPHLAIACDWRDVPDSGPGPRAPRALVWPVGVEGWEDLKTIGWSGVAERLPAPEA
jgi:hypothetical protein